MAGSYAYDGTLLDVVGQGVAVDGDWFELLHSGSTERTRSNVQVSVSMPAGTGTWVLEGRNGPNDSPIQLDTGTAAKTASYPRMAQMRLRWTAAAGLTARGSVNGTLKNVTYTPFFSQQSLWYQGLIGGYWPSADGPTDGSMADVRFWLGDSSILFYGDPSVRSSVTPGTTGKIQTLGDARGGAFTRTVSAPSSSAQPADNGVDTLTFDGVDDVLESAVDAALDMSAGAKCIVVIGTLGASWLAGIIDTVDGSRRFALGTPTGVVRAHISTGNADTTSVAPDATVRLTLANFSPPENTPGDATSNAPWLSADEAPSARAYNETGSAIASGSNILSVGGLRTFGGFSNFQLKAVLALSVNPGGVQLASLQRFATLKKGATLPTAVNYSDAIGDSITAGFDGTTTDPNTSFYGQLITAGKFSGWIQQNRGTPGRWAQTLASRASGEFSEQVNPLRAKNTCFVMAGTNDKQGGRTDAQIAADVQSICRAMKAAGAYVVLLGLTRRAGYDVTGVNAILATSASSVCDIYIDPATSPNLVDPTNLTYFAADQLHLKFAGHTEIMNLILARVPAAQLN